MNFINGKRITFKHTRPNPLFHDWLEELHEEAKQTGSKLEPMLQEALTSISKYPLPLQSGAECAILKGFDKRLCLFIDRRLEVHKSNEYSKDRCSKFTATTRTDDDNDVVPVINLESSDSIKNAFVTQNFTTEHNKKGIIASTSPPIRNRKKIFKPAFRSGSYAFIMVLIELKKSQTMSKGQLIAAAQKYCEKDVSSEWKSMTGLIRRGLVFKSMKYNIPRFCLTDEGISIAKELFSNKQSKKGDDGKLNDLLYDDNNYCNKVVAIDNALSTPQVNDLLFNEYSEVIVINDGQTDSATKSVLHEDSEKKDENKYTNEVTVINDDNKVMPMNSTRTLMHGCSNYEIVENDENHVEYSNCTEMMPGCFDIILLIDKKETSGLTKKNDPTITQFNKYPELKHEYRSLKVGDFTWIARHKTDIDHELVLPYVVERKRMDDLGHSIKDGRFHEQKFRLRKCGLNHVIYMVENHGRNKHVGLPMQSLMQALANTRVQDGFKVHVTDSLAHSVRFLTTMTLRLIYEYKDKRLKGHNGEPKGDILMTFGHFNKSSVKNRALSVTDTFIKLLLQLKGVSVEKALTITTVYKTPRLLIEKYKICDQKDGEMLLANLKFGDLNRSVGPSVSKAVYQLFTFTN